MKRVAEIAALLWFAGVPISASSAPVSTALPMVLNARVGEHDDYTRFVFELSDPVKFRVFTLSAPNRVVIDMPEVLWRPRASDRPTGKGVVRDYRYGLFRPGDSRFIVDLNAPVI